jgi:hypothetical protein
VQTEGSHKDAYKTEKSGIVVKADAFYYSLVSEQPKLCEIRQQKGQTSTDASSDGPQGGMAAVTSRACLKHNNPAKNPQNQTQILKADHGHIAGDSGLFCRLHSARPHLTMPLLFL